ncbi:hypothetical protein GCM10027403_26230 [Arthrobacter tecti]
MGVDLEPETNLLQHRVGLILPGFARLHSGFVLVLTKIHELGYRRLGLGRHLNKIKVGLSGESEGVFNTDDSNLLARRAYQPHLWDADTIIDSWLANVLLLMSVENLDRVQKKKAPDRMRNRRPRASVRPYPENG